MLAIPIEENDAEGPREKVNNAAALAGDLFQGHSMADPSKKCCKKTVVDDLKTLGLGPDNVPPWSRAASTPQRSQRAHRGAFGEPSAYCPGGSVWVREERRLA